MIDFKKLDELDTIHLVQSRDPETERAFHEFLRKRKMRSSSNVIYKEPREMIAEPQLVKEAVSVYGSRAKKTAPKRNVSQELRRKKSKSKH